MRQLIICLMGLTLFSFILSCQKEVSLEFGSPATGSLQSDFGECLPKLVAGSYVTNKTLNDSNFIEVTVNVTGQGPYTIYTDSLNGYFFRATGTFNAIGATTVRLKGSGRPESDGINTFRVYFDTSVCDIDVTVLPSGATGGGCTPTVQGNYTAGTATAATNRVVINYTYATAGSYTVSTNTVNGYSFGPATVTATAGAPTTITLNATGTPTAVGTNTFIVNLGDGQNCSFTVTVGNGTTTQNTDYFPTTANSWWSYDEGTGGNDSFKITNAGPTQVFGGNTYQRFVYSNIQGSREEFYRKDPSNGYYYESQDTAGFGPELRFNTSRLDAQFLRNTLTTNQTWNSDFPATYTDDSTGQQFSVILRYKYTCTNANATLTVNGKPFTNVYVVQWMPQFVVGTNIQDAFDDPITFYYAKGIGLIRVATVFNGINEFQDIRYWQVN